MSKVTFKPGRTVVQTGYRRKGIRALVMRQFRHGDLTAKQAFAAIFVATRTHTLPAIFTG
jgi:hypothetical protein